MGAKRLRVSQCKTAAPVAPADRCQRRQPHEYLRRGPNVPYREVFVRHRAPAGVLMRTGVSNAFQTLVAAKWPRDPFSWAPRLRHSYAVHLLRQGISLKTIGDVLGAPQSGKYLRLSPPFRRGPSRRGLGLPGIKHAEGAAYEPRLVIRVGDQPEHRPFRRAPRRHWAGSSPWSAPSLSTSTHSFPLQRADLDAENFAAWCRTREHLTSGVRRNWMRVVRNLCLYRRRTEPACFVPDPSQFPRSISRSGLTSSPRSRSPALGCRRPAAVPAIARPCTVRTSASPSCCCTPPACDAAGCCFAVGDYDPERAHAARSRIQIPQVRGSCRCLEGARAVGDIP